MIIKQHFKNFEMKSIFNKLNYETCDRLVYELIYIKLKSKNFDKSYE